jgi:hypothetical protein
MTKKKAKENFDKYVSDMGRGIVPWNMEEYLETAQWYHNLKSKPQDEWDLKETGFNLKAGKGTQKITLNKFNSMNQLGLFMIDRFGPEVSKYQIFRFMEIQEFLINNRVKLEKDGLLLMGITVDSVRSGLIKALCELPFSRKVKKGKSEGHEFDYEEVIKAAKANEADEDSTETG